MSKFSRINPYAFKFKHKANKFQNVCVLKQPVAYDGQTLSRPLIKQAILDVCMNMRHNGLYYICRDAGIDPLELQKGEFVLMINPSRSYLAMFGAGGMLTFYNRRFMEKVLKQPIESPPLGTIDSAFTTDEDLRVFLRTYLAPRGKGNVMKLVGE